jgi:alkanesulfonate monooxygenase SsuD/methylene tetrahydromethanopterin reductase-like flavin-dependent oxidoreductase (luciferase family)
MKIGFFAPHTGPHASRYELARTCVVAEAGGADSLWAVDHIAIPYGFAAVYPYAALRCVANNNAARRQPDSGLNE